MDRRGFIRNLTLSSLFIGLPLKASKVKQQNDIYVSPRGNDQNIGSRRHPVRTLSRALEMGSYIILLPGDYIIKKSIEIKKCCTIDGKGKARLILAKGADSMFKYKLEV